MQSRLKNLQNFNAQQKLQQAALMFIGTTMISKEEKNQLVCASDFQTRWQPLRRWTQTETEC